MDIGLDLILFYCK